ncbi:MAG TPA: hypothetical protein VJX94_05290 [Stellaceae bacterium]|nr:hypothetical protein [Stellaceae bacterium]
MRDAGGHRGDRSTGQSARCAAAAGAREATRHQRARSRCGILTFLKDGEAPGRTRDGLRAVNINAHVSRSPRAPALDLPARGVDALVRASVYYYNSRSEVERFVRAVAG